MPLLHLLAGPNGSGKTTFYEHVLKPVTGLPFVNADVIAREQWPDADRDYSYEAAKLATERREAMIANRQELGTQQDLRRIDASKFRTSALSMFAHPRNQIWSRAGIDPAPFALKKVYEPRPLIRAHGT